MDGHPSEGTKAGLGSAVRQVVLAEPTETLSLRLKPEGLRGVMLPLVSLGPMLTPVSLNLEREESEQWTLSRPG